jgi:hypothetical protein
MLCRFEYRRKLRRMRTAGHSHGVADELQWPERVVPLKPCTTVTAPLPPHSLLVNINPDVDSFTSAQSPHCLCSMAAALTAFVP